MAGAVEEDRALETMSTRQASNGAALDHVWGEGKRATGSTRIERVDPAFSGKRANRLSRRPPPTRWSTLDLFSSAHYVTGEGPRPSHEHLSASGRAFDAWRGRSAVAPQGSRAPLGWS